MIPEEPSDRLWQFSARVGKVVDALPDTRLGRHVAGQLVRCGTAPGPNYDEGRVGESRADFIHKLKIALKELVETKGWLKYIVISNLLPPKKIEILRDECEQLCKIPTSSTLTAKGKVRSTPLPPIVNRQSSIINRQSPATAQSA
jgi:four helix bundle protein